MEGRPHISHDVIARYAADAALEVEGVSALADGCLHRGTGVDVADDQEALAVRVHVQLEWGRNAAEVGREVQRRVSEYLERMANRRPESVDVVVDAVGSPPAKQ